MAAQPSADERTHAERVIAFADVHGAYDELTQLLQSAGVVDADLNWSAGATHVVSLGDLLDRGAGSRRVMDLLMRLQSQAAAAGGALHVALGNHEAMNLLGDLRYVTAAEFGAYAADEPPDVRERERREWLARHPDSSGPQFDERFPPGYFGHRAAMAADGKYGRWLLSLPVAVIINNTLFMHGGPSQLLQGLSLEELNRRYRSALADYLSALAAARKDGLVQIEDPFDQRIALAGKRQVPEGRTGSRVARESTDTVRRLDAADRNPLINSDGPNWYRGAALCNEVSESDVLKPLLEGLGVKRLVIGHTPVRNQRAASRFDGTVIKLDAGMNRAAYKGHPAALLVTGDEVRVAYSDESATPGAVPPEPQYVAPLTIDDAALAAALANGSITVGAPRAPGTFEIAVESAGLRIPAVFVQASAETIRKELAAYRLDRALRLGIVPATVEREVNGQRGIVQARPSRWVNQADVERQSLRAGGWCAMATQFELMYAFDALIGNEGRTRERMLYDAAEWMLLLTGHDRAFGTSRALPRHLQSRPGIAGTEMRRRLAALDAPSLERALGDLLSQSERAALLARRDAILAGKASRAASQ